MRLVLYQPEIAGNVGAAIRTAACFGAEVDIVEPCGFPAGDRALKRAAMDYGDGAPPVRHVSWASFLKSPERSGGRLILLSTRADRTIFDAQLTDEDLFIIGQESAGVPPEVRAACALTLKIPLSDGARSLNAATAAAITLAEARRQEARRGAAPPRLIFHIGHPKTATSYLQQAIALNEPALRGAGIRAPVRFRHIGDHDHRALAAAGLTTSGNAQPIFFAFERGDGSVLDAYAPYADGERDLLLSSELFFYYPQFVEIVANYFRALGYRIEIVCYLPRYERALIAGFVQNVRNHAFQNGVVDFIETTRAHRYCRFAAVLDDIEARCAPDKIVVRTFDREFLNQGDILMDFLDVLDIRNPSAIEAPERRINESPPLEVIEALRRLDPKRYARLRRAIIKRTAAPGRPESSRIFQHYYTPEVKAAVEREFAEDRRALISKWFADQPEVADFWRTIPAAAEESPLSDYELRRALTDAFAAAPARRARKERSDEPVAAPPTEPDHER